MLKQAILQRFFYEHLDCICNENNNVEKIFVNDEKCIFYEKPHFMSTILGMKEIYHKVMETGWIYLNHEFQRSRSIISHLILDI